MIETYKIINEKYDPKASSCLKLLSNTENRFSTRTNPNKIIHQRFNTTVRKNSYAVRVPRIWNKLPESITNAPSVNAFKNRLDKHWEREEIYYEDYRAEIKEITGRDAQNHQSSESETGVVAP